LEVEMKKVMILAAIIGLVVFLVKKAMADRQNWQGLTEAEVRGRLNERLPTKIPEDRRQHIAEC
jgi:hypothetical protein